jgi:small subunit ribosomal protein S16
MLAIRLQRTGKTGQPFYRLLVSEKAKDTQSGFLETLGSYNPRSKETKFLADRIKYWLSKGAQASNTVHNLLLKEGILVDQAKRKSVSISKKRAAKKKGPEPAPEAKPVAEPTPAPEAKPAEPVA